MLPFFVFLLGLIFGSFINAVVHRLKVEKSFIKDRSKCVWCDHVLAVKDLVPVLSWVFLRGKCRYCRRKISPHYPVVELFTALSFLVVYYVVGISDSHFLVNLQLATFLIFTVFLIIIFIYDLKHYLILDQVVLPASVLAFVLNYFLGIPWWSMLLAAFLGSGFFLIQYVVSKGKWIGGGDIKLGFLMGLMLGWPEILAALFLAYVIGSVIGVLLILFGKKKWGGRVPFGTFLTLGTYISMLYGEELIAWYLNLLYV